MNTTTFTIESVHGLKQTIVLVPFSSKESAEKLTVSPVVSQPQEDDRKRSSK